MIVFLTCWAHKLQYTRLTTCLYWLSTVILSATGLFPSVNTKKVITNCNWNELLSLETLLYHHATIWIFLCSMTTSEKKGRKGTERGGNLVPQETKSLIAPIIQHPHPIQASGPKCSTTSLVTKWRLLMSHQYPGSEYIPSSTSASWLLSADLFVQLVVHDWRVIVWTAAVFFWVISILLIAFISICTELLRCA